MTLQFLVAICETCNYLDRISYFSRHSCGNARANHASRRQNGDQDDADGHVCDHWSCLRLWWFYWLYAHALAFC